MSLSLTLRVPLTLCVPLTLRAPPGGMTGGVFVDIGASDGLLGSNTYLLEKCFGWKGICIEPRTNEMIKLKMANRTCSTAQVALSDAPGVGQLILAGGLSGLEKHQNNLNAARVQVRVSLPVSVCLSNYRSIYLSLSRTSTSYSYSYSYTHTLTITCTCCHAVIKGTQDQDLFSCRFSDSLSLHSLSPVLVVLI